MLEMKPFCERCENLLPPDSNRAYICSFECTFCAQCNASALHNVCPNCQGQLIMRPSRVGKALLRHPAKKIHRDKLLPD